MVTSLYACMIMTFMEQTDQPTGQNLNTLPFNEGAWIKLIILLSDKYPCHLWLKKLP